MKSNTAMKAAEAVEEKGSSAEKTVDKPWKAYIELSKPGIVMSNLLTAFTGFFVAAQYTAGFSLGTNIHILLLTMFGIALVLAGGTTLNNYIDTDIDPLMESKKERPTVTGAIALRKVLYFGLLLSAAGIAILLAIEPVAAVIAAIGLFVYVVVYSLWLKRTHSLNTIIGSIAGATPPLIGWAAVDPGLHMYAWLMFAVMFIWQPPHFLALAMMRVEEYRKANVPMLPVVAGFTMTKRQILVYIAALLPISLLLYPFGMIYTIVAAALGIGWLVLSLKGLRTKDDMEWARSMFMYSLVYLTVIFVVMVAVHL
ncbi:protoheme IX farnesyltransferase [Salicibibacter halophilus]|uniref:Protoheme IX farnesyltransferase n=1 Tax=Salicibibacter halophilus TaxID=2502791 RepID=A0A514LFK3_9BACI|nr:heme o synthase [Salicibibacter halophilus]QDI90638.1 protoheme IX farnesyltransferase [Salicibibacter halophilus]